MMRQEFTTKVRTQSYERAGGRCEWVDNGFRCATVLVPGDVHFDHIIPFAISVDSSLSNCQALCKAHHGLKTARDDAPWIAKTRRQHQDHIGASRPSGKIRSRGFPPPAAKDRTTTKVAARRPMFVPAETIGELK